MTNEETLQLALVNAAKALGVELSPESIVIERTKDPAHGDYATNLAMRSARAFGKAPRDVANLLLANFTCDHVEKTEIAGPGFINFFMKKESLGKIVETIIAQGENYGRLEKKGIKVDVEFVSANPTGDLHLGHTRGAALGDAICNLYDAAGYDVTREYYLNDCGNQVEHLGHSLSLRYHELFGEKITLGDDDYHGQDLIKIAEKIKEEFGDKYLVDNKESHDFFIRYGIDTEFGKIQKDLADFRVKFDVIFKESQIREGTLIEDTMKELKDKGYLYEKDGATFLATSKYFDDKDRPIVKADGCFTYFMPDICYHYNKMSRGYDICVDMLGADHFGYINRMRSALEIGGYSSDRLAMEIYQIVKVFKDGEEVKMSKRTGKAITHRELVSEIGVDAVRYFFIDKAPGSHLDFNYDLATSKSKDNPVYYTQYAHARCASLLNLGSDIELDLNLNGVGSEKETDILKHLAAYPSMIDAAAKIRAPYKVTAYIEDLAALVHEYYASTKIIDRNDLKVSGARLALIKACQIVLRNALTLIGVSAPDKM